jgi:NAD(P)-dependent dehydrogenase (short-subunit alcohol dehydrogenase family)
MARVFVTGSAGGLGRHAAAALLDEGHEVVVHARDGGRLASVEDLLARGAVPVTGDLSSHEATVGVAAHVNALGVMDAVIHNAAVFTGTGILAVNVLAPYLLTCLIDRPGRLVYLSSGMHRGGRAALAALTAAPGRGGQASYSDSKLYVSTLATAVARRWPNVYSNAVDPGWVPTRMGGPRATDDLELGHVTQVWLAVSDDPQARASGRYWYHQQQHAPHPAVLDETFQEQLLHALARLTGVQLPLPAPATTCRSRRGPPGPGDYRHHLDAGQAARKSRRCAWRPPVR